MSQRPPSSRLLDQDLKGHREWASNCDEGAGSVQIGIGLGKQGGVFDAEAEREELVEAPLGDEFFLGYCQIGLSLLGESGHARSFRSLDHFLPCRTSLSR